MIIRVKHFVLRPFRRGDEASLVRHINNPKIYRNTLRIPYPYRMRDAREWVRKCRTANHARKKTDVNFAIEIDGGVAGGIGLSHIVPRHKAEIGYWLGEEYWGKGIMTEAAKRVTRFGFKNLRLKRIYAGVFPRNRASMRVLEKAGYEREGILRKQARKKARFINEVLYAIVR